MLDCEEMDKVIDDKWGSEIRDDKVYVTEDRDISRILLKVDHEIREFCLSDFSLSLKKSVNQNTGELIYKKVSFGDVRAIAFQNKQIKAFFDYYLPIRDYRKRGLLKIRAFSPYITAYLQWMDDIDQSVNSFDTLRSIHGQTVSYQALEQRIYKCFEKLSEKLSNPQFQKLILKSQKTSDKNYKSMLSYIDKLFDRKARLLVVRVDLSYKQAIADVRRREQLGMDEHVSEFEQVKADLERLLRHRRHNKIFHGLLGYIWKLEYGVTRGYHYHMVFFFDGAKHCHDVLIGKRIGDYWNKNITQGRGAYFNVNGSKCRYQNDIRGSVNYSDTEAKQGLMYLTKYFSKPDYFMRLELPKKYKSGSKQLYRTLGKGQVQMRTGKKRGRPRKSGHLGN
ncbi:MULTISPECIES: inovirus-type Gp2 protein [unclassified Neptuniibacter]|uniref:YagK/YfjJ domain-containing protein n=1 Tax=unclassified Neptuniibacter TaxID=2630693 RepID=UPI0025E765F9|nr:MULTISPECIES: inovirus-type Gp2 protein [unclassified Neptuniibacter]|tara:strand:+ start:4976 stop:6154 length:1179 start_codon:yes stop_codon:yes gene_type:complete